MRRVALIAVLLVLSSPARAGKPELIAAGAEYADALRVANEFLQAWSHHDSDGGLELVSHRLRSTVDESGIRQYIEGTSNPHNWAFEVGAGTQVDSTRYSFPVVFYACYFGESGVNRAEGILQLVREQSAWRVDSLPPARR